MVECLVWDQDAAGSSPVTSTTDNRTIKPFIRFLVRFFVLKMSVKIRLKTLKIFKNVSQKCSQ